MMSWYPFRSTAVRDICDHLTLHEQRQLKVIGMKTGLGMGALLGLMNLLLMVVIFSAAMRYVPQAWQLVFFFAASQPIGLFVGWIVGKPLRRRQRQFLCETEYARRIGYTPDTLPLYESQFSLRALLFLVMPCAAVCAWIAAWDGPLEVKLPNERYLNQMLKAAMMAGLIMLVVYVMTPKSGQGARKTESSQP